MLLRLLTVADLAEQFPIRVHATAEHPRCWDTIPNGHICTRDAGHDGPHIAHGHIQQGRYIVVDAWPRTV